ncbi:MAG: hypothetical protein R3E01_10940 [Pirellulaceae bacterium]|nr:hypothetical protein [Planctomycetales bacterium]
MSALSGIPQRIAANPICGYGNNASPAVEPTAWATIALTAAGLFAPADTARRWLLNQQKNDGSWPSNPHGENSVWTTSLALLACLNSNMPARAAIDRGVASLLANQGKSRPKHPNFGHDSEITGWAWVSDTSSWVEPTALAVLALKAAGYGDHWRTREGVRLLKDRLLPDGGCNYGNTSVLGNVLRPHVQPSGLALLALAGESSPEPTVQDRVAKSLGYLERSVDPRTTVASLSFALLGLAAHQRRPAYWQSALETAWQRSNDTFAWSAYRASLVVVTDLYEQIPVFPQTISSRPNP